MRKARVLILFSSGALGGAERSLSRMAFSTTEVTYELATLMGEGPWAEWVRLNGMEPVVLGRGGFHGSGGMPLAIIRLVRYLKKNPTDIVYVCGVRASLWIRFLRIFFRSTKLVHAIRWNPESNSKLDLFFRLSISCQEQLH